MVFEPTRLLGHGCASQSGRQRNLHRSHESADHHHGNLRTYGGRSYGAGTVSYDAIDFIATFTPTAPLTASTSYNAMVTSGATDLAGNPLGTTGAPNPWMFTTGTAAVLPPIVLGPAIALFGGFGGGAGMTNQGITQ